MDSKKIRKSLSYLVSWLGLTICSLIVKVIPARYLYSFACNLSSLRYLLVAKQRKVALDNLQIAFGDAKSKAEIQKIAKDSFTLMSKGAVELLFLMDRPALLRKRVELIGKKYLDEALARDKGVILVSAHFGNFPLLMAKLSLEGYKVAGIMRQMRDTRVEKKFLAKRTKLGIKTIYFLPRTTCVNSTIFSLRGNEIVFIPMDQNFGTGGVFVDFFGRKAATATGPVVLAQRTKAALLPCFIVRQPDDSHRIIFEPQLELTEGKDAEETISINIQRLTNIIESYIKKYPAEWGWVHRRWKSKQN